MVVTETVILTVTMAFMVTVIETVTIKVTVSDSEFENYSDRVCETFGNSQSQDNIPKRWVTLSSALWNPGHLAEVCNLLGG